MGYRTVVMLNNDRAHEWSKDPTLGREIMLNMHDCNQNGSELPHGYGSVVECTHADNITIAALDGYTDFKGLGFGSCGYGPTTDEHILQAFKMAAFKLGYRLVKLPTKKA